VIDVEHLVFEYPGIRALKGVSFHIPAGSVTALVGPNGAGKTTLLRCMAGLERPFFGRIRIQGVDISQNPRSCHRHIGYLPDFFGLYDRLSVRRILSHFASAHDLSIREIPDRVGILVQRLNLAAKFDEPAGNLSRGMRQRLALGIALIHEPAILLLDEPASGLDPEARRSLSELLVSLSSEAGTTIVVSSHILAELNEYATDLLILEEGVIVSSPGAAVADVRTIVVEASRFPDGIPALLQSREDVESVSATPTALHIEFRGNDDRQHDLLRTLIEEDVPVTAFYEMKRGVKERYMEYSTRPAGK
jgi:ABC-2 type transport system ATP-binding protein